MHDDSTARDGSDLGQLVELPAVAESTIKPLPSGRVLVVRTSDDGEEIEVRAPGGDLELCVRLTDAGPVLRMEGGRVELDATDTLKLSARDLEIEGREQLTLRSGDDMLVEAEGALDIHSRDDCRMVASIIWLN